MIAPCPTDLLQRDAFLSAQLERDVRTLDVAAFANVYAREPNPLAEAMESLEAPALVYAKVPSDVAPDLQPCLRSHGFELVDVAVTLERTRMDAASRDGGASAFALRPAEAADEDAVAHLAEAALVTSRFHRDRWLSSTEAARIKNAWARSYFAGMRGDVMFVAQRAGSDAIDGFLLALRADDGAMVIDLVAVDERARRQGLCRAMTIAAQAHFPRSERTRVGTQGSNAESLLAYRSMGFAVVRTDAVMHAHVCAESHVVDVGGRTC